jgi:hypothetical protein
MGRLSPRGRFSEFAIPTQYSFPESITMGPDRGQEDQQFARRTSRNPDRCSMSDGIRLECPRDTELANVPL